MTPRASELTSRASPQHPPVRRMPAVQFHAFVDALDRLGYDVDALLRDIGVERSDFADPDGTMPRAATGNLLKRSQHVRPLKNLWARIAAATPLGAYPIATSDTVGESFRQHARYHRLVPSPLTVEIRDDESPIRVVFILSAVPESIEFNVVINVHHLRAETESPLAFEYASFTHEPDDVSEIERMIGCPVRTRASWAGLALNRDAWELPLRRRDPILHRILEAQADDALARTAPSEDLAHQLRSLLRSRVASGKTEIDLVARELGMSPRTLQRRLALSGWSYHEIVDGIRRDLAEKCMLDSTLSIAEAGYLAGYSEPAAFHRAFKRWTGIAPREFRKLHRVGPSWGPGSGPPARR
jgi:AraC-like DNA-binding protein